MIKKHGGVFGRNPTFNDVDVQGDLSIGGELILNGSAFATLSFQGTWDASTNTPTLSSGSGINGGFYIVSVAGSTVLDGVSNWGIGDWATFNGSVWQRVEGGADGNFVNLTATGTVTLPDNAISGDKVEGGTIDSVTINTLTTTTVNSTTIPTSKTLVTTDDIGTTVQGYDADTAKYDDATANFTGALQVNGSNVLTSASLGTMSAQDADSVAISGGTINGTSVGASSASSGAFTTLSASGNVTLGDSSADTVQVNGYMGVGGAPNSSIAIFANPSALAGVSQTGIYSLPVSTSAATTVTRSFLSLPSTAAAAYTSADVVGYWAANALKGAGSTITNQYGVLVADQTQGTNNYGITSLVSSGSDKWNVYASGTARNYMAGALSVGATTDPGTGGLYVAGNTTLGDSSTDTVQVSGYMGVGGSPTSDIGVYLQSTPSSATPRGFRSSPTFSSSATSNGAGFISAPITQAATFTIGDIYHFRAAGTTKGAGSTITNLHGVYIDDQTQGTNNYGITSLVSSGSNKWNIYASGSAANYFAGNVGIGTSSPSYNLQVASAANAATAFFSSTATPAYNSSGYNGSSARLQLVGGSASGAQTGINLSQGGAFELFIGGVQESGGAAAFVVQGYDGSAYSERLRITSSGNVGIGTSAPDALLNISAASPVFRIDNTGTTGDGLIHFGDSESNFSGVIQYNHTSDYMALFSDSVERLRLGTTETVFNETGADVDFRIESDTTTHAFFLEGSSGNVGIGTSSPGALFQVGVPLSATAGIRVSGTYLNIDAGYQSAGVNGTSSAPSLILGGDADTGFWHPASDTLAVSTAGSERLRIDASGNLGLGVTPSAWGNGASMQGSAWALSTTSGTDSAAFSVNARQTAYGSGSQNWVYRTAAPATNYEQFAGNHVWYTAGSGTAGDPISFPEVMRINPSGNVGVGTSAPTVKLDVVGSDNNGIQYRTATRTIGIGSIGGVNALYGGSGSELVFHIGSERMRIDSSGNVGIGTSTPGVDLHISSASSTKAIFERTGSAGSFVGLKDSSGLFAYLGNTNGTFEVQTSGSGYSTKLAITTTGNVGIGTSTPSRKLTVVADGAIGGTEQVFITGETDVNNQLRIGYDTSTNVGVIQAITAGTAYRSLTLSPSGGNVGIGTSTPSEALEVSGNIKTTAPTGGTAAAWKLGTVATVSPTSPNRTIEVEVNGTIYYLAAKTTND